VIPWYRLATLLRDSESHGSPLPGFDPLGYTHRYELLMSTEPSIIKSLS
jgi:hypothetical protein